MCPRFSSQFGIFLPPQVDQVVNHMAYKLSPPHVSKYLTIQGKKLEYIYYAHESILLIFSLVKHDIKATSLQPSITNLITMQPCTLLLAQWHHNQIDLLEISYIIFFLKADHTNFLIQYNKIPSRIDYPCWVTWVTCDFQFASLQLQLHQHVMSQSMPHKQPHQHIQTCKHSSPQGSLYLHSISSAC